VRQFLELAQDQRLAQLDRQRGDKLLHLPLAAPPQQCHLGIIVGGDEVVGDQRARFVRLTDRNELHAAIELAR